MVSVTEHGQTFATKASEIPYLKKNDSYVENEEACISFKTNKYYKVQLSKL